MNDTTIPTNELVLRQSALLELFRLNTTQLQRACQRICEVSARALLASRVGIWKFSPGNHDLECVDLYDANEKRHFQSEKLPADAISGYCESLESSLALVADDALHDVKIRELAPHYLIPANIASKLDIPTHLQGLLAGVVSCEQTGTARQWREEEIGFLSIVASIVSLVLESEQKKQAEEALQESEAKFRILSDSALDAILMMDTEGKITFWNKAAEVIFGYAQEEAMGRPLHQLIAPEEYHEAHRLGFEGFRKTGQGAAIGKRLELKALRRR